MTDLTLGQKIRLGLGALALLRKHSDLIPELRVVANDALALWDSVVPLEPVSKVAPIHETIATHLTPEEQAQFDRATQDFGAG